MTEPAQTSVPVFVSYSHDSVNHKRRVLDLANRLRSDGVDCEIDQWVTSPPEGWPKWMMRRISAAKFVLVVCTEIYHQRVTGTDDTGSGSRWEGVLITEALYDAGGANTKFIPVICEPGDEQHRPAFLRGATYYRMDADYERLYRHLTDQPASMRPPLGEIRRLEPEAASSSAALSMQPQAKAPGRDLSALVLLWPIEGEPSPFTALSRRIESSDRLVVDLTPEDAESSAAINACRQRRGLSLGIAFGTTPVFGRLQNATQTFEAGDERWRLEILPSTEHLQGATSEMSFNNRSADQLVEMRVRRLLLNEQFDTRADSMLDQINRAALETFVSGLNALVPITASPFPGLFRALGSDPEYFLAAARLAGVLLLYLSTTVDRVHRLDLHLTGPQTLSVVFEGRRPRRFVNTEPAVLGVAGECDLSVAGPERRAR